MAVEVSGWQGYLPEELPVPDNSADLLERAAALDPPRPSREYEHWTRWRLRLGTPDADAARAYGCLLELPRGSGQPAWQFLEYQDVQRRTLKSGERRERISYAEPPDAADGLRRWIERGRTPEAVLGRTLQAVIASRYADPRALPQSKRASPPSALRTRTRTDGRATRPSGRTAPATARRLLPRPHPRTGSPDPEDGQPEPDSLPHATPSAKVEPEDQPGGWLA